ncbi:42130_t:CDS:2 [Gigaspora margarita]|uniref:42130_t:CDS:1 n=1 Tax=Gigaspora margarita TaxID=4874 RepID=A0ABN7WES3_GIGMA|nr:42130_t:CDS:2 [Gigaspora margarita]
MPNPKQKKKEFYNTPVLIFTSAHTYILDTFSSEDSVITNTPKSELEQNLDIADSHLIEHQVCEYIVQMAKKDGKEYKPKTVQQAVNEINKYLVKHGSIQSLNLYNKSNLQEKGLDEKEATGIWYYKKHCGINKVQNFIKDSENKVKVQLPDGILTNHSGKKTAAQIFQDADISEDAIMNITGHQSAQELLANSTNITAQDFFVVLTESTKSYINVNIFSSQILTHIDQSHIASNLQNQPPNF